jgi:hypothetical protein
LATARAWHSATLLNDGRVLATGGFDGTNSLSSAETFSPTSGSWTGSGSMAGARERHAATLLSSGTFAGLVLITGGQQAGGVALSSAAIFDPAGNAGVGTFTATTSQMTVARTGHTATFLPASETVLVAGGSNQNLPATTGKCGALNTASLFDPAGSAAATGLPTVGGAAGAALLGTFTQTADPDGTATTLQGVAQGRAAHVAFLLGDGRVLLAGGTDCDTAGSPSALPTGERYIP